MNIEFPEAGKVSMDPRVRYSSSIKGFETEKRHLRMTDKEEEIYLAKRKEFRNKLRELRLKKPL